MPAEEKTERRFTMKKKVFKVIKAVVEILLIWVITFLVVIGSIALIKPEILYPDMWQVETQTIYIFERSPISGTYV